MSLSYATQNRFYSFLLDPVLHRLIKCTRWAELTETMLFQAELSESLQVVSDFRLLNGADPVIVGLGDDDGESLKFFREVLSESPAGPTPLCMHIEAIVQCIQSVEHELRANGQKAVVMIATDGESSDGNVAEALRPLTNVRYLPHHTQRRCRLPLTVCLFLFL